ncbi:artemis protein [Astrocystis sublimbata]|nr:artemis protein [Astrocystis sublimbata]
MSTFKGVISEFPGIIVDYFRRQPGVATPLASFLSHVHSDHLVGLETFNGTFIYCSAATKEILLRLEKSSVRLNHARGILEDPRQQTYRHLEKKLKPIPLDTPTIIELEPGRNIQVTLLYANHCVGAVMFLFEDANNAVLYTGDIRCEPRFVTAITENPNMIEYSSRLRTLDRIYLDTSIVYDYPLQSKADGLREMLGKLQHYPDDTVFHFQAWTYGYEEVWIALSRALKSKIHVDDYQRRIFRSLATKSTDNRWAAQTHLAKEAPALVGFTCANNQQEGCLTRNENVRVHSCGRGMGCSVVDNQPVVWIRPIVSHLVNGTDVMEVGIGGGGEDLARPMTLSNEDIVDILELDTFPPEIGPYIRMLKKAQGTGRDLSFIDDFDGPAEEALPWLIQLLCRKLENMHNPLHQNNTAITDAPLPDVIYFPYARHSSLPELRDFVGAFDVKDIVPCTFDADTWLQHGWSIRGLFGDLCSGNEHEYDRILEQRAKQLAVWQMTVGKRDHDSQQTTGSTPHPSSPPSTVSDEDSKPKSSTLRQRGSRTHPRPDSPVLGELEEMNCDYGIFRDELVADNVTDLYGKLHTAQFCDRREAVRREAFAIVKNNMEGGSWESIGLISTTDHHTYDDVELGREQSRSPGHMMKTAN